MHEAEDEAAAAAASTVANTPPPRDEDAPRPGYEDGIARQAAINTSALAAGELIGKAAMFVLAVMTARYLGKDELGAIAYGLALGAMLAILPEWGFDPIVQQRGALHPARLNRYLAESLVWRTVLAVPVMAVGAVIALGGADSLQLGMAVLIVATSVVSDAYFDALRAAAAARKELVRISVALIVQRLTTVAVAVAALLAGAGVVAVAAAYLLGSLVGLLLSWRAMAHADIHPAFHEVRRSGLVTMFKRSSPVALSAIISVGLFRADTIIIEASQGMGVVAEYAVAYKLFETCLFLSWAVSKSVFSYMSEAIGDRPRVRRFAEQSLAVLSAAYLPLGTVMLLRASEIIGLVFGQQYVATSSAVLQLLALSPAAFAVGYILIGVLISQEHTMPTMWAALAATLFNVALNLALIPRLGPPAAAAVNTASYLIEALILYVCCVKVVGWVRLDRILAAPLTGSIALGALLVAWHGPLLVVTAAGTLVYAAVWFGVAKLADPVSAHSVVNVAGRAARHLTRARSTP